MGDLFASYTVEESVLEHNLYGVDINEDAVEIAKLSNYQYLVAWINIFNIPIISTSLFSYLLYLILYNTTIYKWIRN